MDHQSTWLDNNPNKWQQLDQSDQNQQAQPLDPFLIHCMKLFLRTTDIFNFPFKIGASSHYIISACTISLSLSLFVYAKYCLNELPLIVVQMEKLKSSFKSLQAAMASRKLPSPTCIQEAKTLSFREEGIYSNIPVQVASSSSSSDVFKLDIGNFHQLPIDILLAYLDAHFICSGYTTLPSGSSSQSSFPNEPSDNLSRDEQQSAKRFFFSPTTTKSIIEEYKIPELCSPEGGEIFKRASFFEESSTESIASDDPYYDFRASMEEMVVAHALRDWNCLQELLHCYLKLNKRKHHKTIVLAFLDLLRQIKSQDS